MKKYLLGLISGIIICGGIGLVIAVTYNANDITYTPANNTWNVNNVDGAINDLYTRTETYKKLDITTNATTNDILSGKTAYDNNGNLIIGSHESDNGYVILETGTYNALSQGKDSVKEYTISLQNTYTSEQNAQFIVTNVYNANYPNNWYGRFNSTKEKIIGNSFSLGVCNYSGSWQNATIDYVIIGYNK